MNIPFLSRRQASTDVTVMGGPPLCRDKAQSLVHKYAAFGTAWAILPIPIATSAGLTALETHMIYWIARTYGEEPTKSDVLMAAGGLELCSVALKSEGRDRRQRHRGHRPGGHPPLRRQAPRQDGLTEGRGNPRSM
jgi:hypothetical protein